MDIDAIISLLTVKTFVVGITTFLLVMSYLQRKKYKLPPGPPQLPILGSYFAFRNDGRLYSVFSKLGKSFGDLFSVDLGFWHTVVVLKSADIVHEALVEKKETFAGRGVLTWKYELFSGRKRDLIFSDYGPVWRLQKQMALKAFRTYVASDKLEMFTRSAFDEIAALIEKETEPFDMHVYMRLLIFNIVCRMAFGKVYKINEPEFVWLKGTLDESMEKVYGSIIPSDVIPVLKHLPIPSSLSTKRLLQGLIDFQKVKLEDHKRTINLGEARDITDQMLLLREELTAERDDDVKESLSDLRILHTILDIFFAGTQTTSDTLIWMILYAADNPNIQEKIHEELDSLGDDFCDLRQCRSKLPYCEAVQREVLRMRPAGPVSIPHRALCDTKLGGYDIPKNTLIFANIWAIHHDPKNWESPEVFMPERFLEKDGSLKELDKKTWLPFSSGKRKCVGEAIARTNIMTILILFFRQFEVSFPPGQKPDFEPAMLELACMPKPQKIIVKKRQ
ncbi:cytochrome P450 1A1 [Lingula anatina]|uniref:Cytochrome P450 1A1 n=1 Tax=Lingula anatina TaxID=7574 RepID=A0A1S3I374_LINAN|nr:cytochrome P450 1A1 [Lingula anatina]|eukprot:XP_013392720.1 cytochrome P450 1A1 [Lingula anatina]